MKEIYEKALLEEKPINLVWHKNSNKIAVIMDPRYDDLMVGVIRNFMKHLNPSGWNLLIITHEMYKDQIYKEFSEANVMFLSEKRVYYKDNYPNITIDTYNGIMMSTEFWNCFQEENILVFQKDCYMYKMFDEDYYMKFAFCGATCIWLSEDEKKRDYAINGGCSLRKKTEMIDCLQKVSWEIIERYYPKLQKYNEDLFFSFASLILNKLLPSFEERLDFAVENQEQNEKTSFYHGWNKNYQCEEKAKENVESNNFNKA